MADTVLVVQDNQTIQKELAALLHQHSYEVLLASDGEEGWTVFNTRQEPCSVVTALRMPNLDGVSLLRRIKTKSPDVKVVLVAGAPNPDAEAEATALGALGILTWPLEDVEALLRLLAT